MFRITTERPEDHAAIEHLLDRAFGPDRHGKTSYRYREGVAPESGLSLVARDGGAIVGSIRYWPVLVGDEDAPALLLGPLAVAPERQGTGVGAALMGTSLAMASRARHRLVLLVGERAYYARFGFAPAAPKGIVMPGERPERLLFRELAEGALDGVAGAVRRWPAAWPGAGQERRGGLGDAGAGATARPRTMAASPSLARMASIARST